MEKVGRDTLLKESKWSKLKSEEVQDLVLDLILGISGIVLINISLGKFVDWVFKIVLMLGDKL